jgi:hypothetical protein
VRISLRLAICALFAAFTVGAQADTITYSESAIVSGSIGNTNFTNALITLTATGSSSTVVVGDLPGIFINILPTELTIAGIGSTMFTDSIQFVSNTISDLAGVGDMTTNLAVLFTQNSVFGGYNLQTGIDATTGPSVINIGAKFGTELGLFSIVSSGPSTFQATDTTTPTVPEPSAFTLLGTGILGLTGVVRRKFLSRS